MPIITTICAPTAAAVSISSTICAPKAAASAEEPNLLFDPTHQTQPSPINGNLYDSSDSENEEGLFNRAKADFWKEQELGS